MSTQTIVWDATRDDMGIYRFSDGASFGAGKDDHVMVGSIGNYKARGYWDFAENYYCPNGKRAKRLIKAEFVVRTSGGQHQSIGSVAYASVSRVEHSWSEGSRGSDEQWGSSNGFAWDNMPSCYGAVGLKKVSNDLTTYRFTVTSLMDDVIPPDMLQSDGVTPGGDASFWGLRLTARDSNNNLAEDSGDTGRYSEWVSLQGSSGARGRLELTVDDNQPPTAATDLSPTGDAVVMDVRFAGTFNDTDEGNYIGPLGAEFLVYADNGTTVLGSFNWKPPVNTKPTTFDVPYPLAPLPTGSFLRWKVRYYDQGGSVSPYSAQQRFKINPKPKVANPVVDTDLLTPYFRGLLSSTRVGATLSNVQVLVADVSSGITVWDSGSSTASGTTYQVAYSGPIGLAWGVKMRYNLRIQDDLGTWSDWLPAWREWTPTQVTGPTNMTPRDLTVLQLSKTPTLTIGHVANFDNYEEEVYDNPDGTGTALWDVPSTVTASTASKATVYAGATLANGRIYYWRAKVRNASTLNWTEWSPLVPFYINSLPKAPRLGPGAAQVYGLGGAGDVVTVPTLTPTLSAPFDDVDAAAYGQAPFKRELEFRRVSDNASILSLVQTTGITAEFAPATLGATFVANTLYRWRARYQDANAAGEWGAWSEYQYLKTTAAPVVTAGAAPDVTDPTPTISWVATNSGAKAQAYAAVRVKTAAGDLVWDTGIVAYALASGATATYILSPGVLANGGTYTYEVDSYDTDDLKGSLAATSFGGVTNFVQPHQVTGSATIGGVTTTLAAAALVGATNLKLVSVTGLAVGKQLMVGAGYTTDVFTVLGPQDAVTGVFNGTAGAGGTGINLDRPLNAPQASGAVVTERDPIALVLDSDTGIATLTWAASQLPPGHFYAYRIYRLNNRTSEYDEIALLTDQTTASYGDEEAYIGTLAQYRVTQDNGVFESDPADVDDRATNTDWYWITPGFPSQSGKVIVNDYSFGRDVISDTYIGIGAKEKLVEMGEVLDYDGSVTLQVLNEDRGVIRMVEQSVQNEEVDYLVLKDYNGNVYRVLVTGRIDRRPWGGVVPVGEYLSIPVTVTVP